MAREAGINSINFSPRLIHEGKAKPSDVKRFVAACHRGFQKAQDAVVKELTNLSSTEELPEDEKGYREILLRKVIDHIAFTMLQGKVHVQRRIGYLDEIPSIDLSTVYVAQKEANNHNEMSRSSFSLLADLSTFIHVCDILKIETQPEKKISYIELKSGKTNEFLMDRIKNIELKDESIDIIEKDLTLTVKQRKQAKRMLRQKIRIANVEEVISTDSGIDLGTRKPIRLSKDYVNVDDFGGVLQELIDVAVEKSLSSHTVDRCLHLAVGYSESIEEARKLAALALQTQVALARAGADEREREVIEEINRKIAEGKSLTLTNLFKTNLISVPSEPFTTWPVSINNLKHIIEGKAIIYIAFDLPLFLALAKSMNIELSLASRSATTKVIEQYGSSNVPRWDNRGIEFKSINGRPVNSFLLSGFIGRFFVNLTTPSSFLQGLKESSLLM
ncbi:hypothetical protein L1280_001315 [Deinococcus sp. HSC-46F16]|uniref:hypothetical protein n=1 Tax=Deinococcus sp. HSC-46F16 TaxID=2910968 RepID=UPI00209FA55A|nr:hypothetical protein [Deinococcus sp. HSC-46F16]MCP2014178.1 hypothetical protein [Deinococcus sp. HSC-46F16]